MSLSGVLWVAPKCTSSALRALFLLLRWRLKLYCKVPHSTCHCRSNQDPPAVFCLLDALSVPGVNCVSSKDALWRYNPRNTVNHSNLTPVLGSCNHRRDILILYWLIAESIWLSPVPPLWWFLMRYTFRWGLRSSLFVSWWKPLDSFRDSYSARLTILLLLLGHNIALYYITWYSISVLYCCLWMCKDMGCSVKVRIFSLLLLPLLSLLMKWHSRNILVAHATRYEMWSKLDWRPVWTAVQPSDLTYKALWSFSLGYLEFNISAFF